MMFGGGACGSVGLGSIMQDPGAIVDPTSLRPILTEINGVDARERIKADSLRIQDTLGQPVTADFVLINPQPAPVAGDKVRIFYHAQLIFAGTMDAVSQSSSDLAAIEYTVRCLDWTHTLIRRKVQRNFTDVPIQNVVDSLLDNELANEGLTIGTIESRSTLPLVDSKGGKALDLLRDMAAATGQTFYLEFSKAIQMRSTLVGAAPLVLNEANVLLEGTTVDTDRDTYRNVQKVIVTGTPQVDGQKALTTQQERRNEDQIAARKAIEGGSGLYEEIEEITHPTSNDGADIALLGISYARLRLATSGTPRTTAQCAVRGYGFRAGQMATVDLPTFGLMGTFAVQRVTIHERAGTLLFHDLELTNSSLQQRAYESWLGIVQGAKVTVQVPGSLTNNLAVFDTPGSFTWTVPAGVTTVELTSVGGSGGGSESWVFATYSNYGNGGPGGASGKAISVVDVNEGAVFDLVIGAAGTASTGIAQSGEASVVSLSGVIKCQGDGGGGGNPAYLSGSSVISGAPGSNGAGVGDAVSVGGGVAGGIGATAVPIAPAMNGQDGRVEVRW